MSKQPEALEIAGYIDHAWGNDAFGNKLRRAAAELRRLHEANAELIETLQEAIEYIPERARPVLMAKARKAIAKHGGQ